MDGGREVEAGAGFLVEVGLLLEDGRADALLGQEQRDDEARGPGTDDENLAEETGRKKKRGQPERSGTLFFFFFSSARV